MAIEPCDLFSATVIDPAELERFYKRYGFRRHLEADRHLREIATFDGLTEGGGAKLVRLLEAVSHGADPDLALTSLERYLTASAEPTEKLHSLLTDSTQLDLLICALGGSSFLARVLIRNPDYIEMLGEEGLKETKARPKFLEEARTRVRALAGDRERLAALHHFQHRELLRIGVRDLSGIASVREVTKELSWLADAVIQVVLEEASRQLGLNPTLFGFAVIGLGKLGGEELNFSSDIDIFYIYSAAIRTDTATRLARRINRYLTDPSVAGVFYRVDLRLRPEGTRGPMASSMESLATYYERWGETFERLALSKARCVAGDSKLGEAFLNLAKPFVYRRYLDYAAIDEVGGIKRRIDQQVEASGELVRNVKLGRGGIREIEFFVQSLQVLYGGEMPDLRVRSTLDALEKLEENRLVEPEVVSALIDAYIFLRDVEHKLQIVEQRQTHTLPEDEDELDRCARRMRMSPSNFRSGLEKHRRRVRHVFEQLFVDSVNTEEAGGTAVYRFVNETMDRDESVNWLRSCGFDDARQAYEILVSLRDAPTFGHSPRRMKNSLTNVLTLLLDAAIDSVRPSKVLTGFERLTSAMGAREAFFSSLLGAQGSVGRLARVFAVSETLSETLIRKPGTAEFLIDEGRLDHRIQPPFETDSRQMLEFYIGVQYLFGRLTRIRASRLMSLFAERRLRRLLSPDTMVALFALGKFGERELSYRSDLDIIAFYEGDYEAALADVESVCATLEQEYKIDLRLRPEGRKGSLVWNVEGTTTYLRDRAVVWERMAWTKARFVAGNARLGSDFRPIIDEFVYSREFDRNCVDEMKHIRMRMETELAKEADRAWDLKLGKGGLVDLEFLAEFFQIRDRIRIPNTALALKRARVSPKLIDDYYFLRELEAAVRLVSSLSTSRIEEASIPTLEAILDLSDLSERYRETTERVREAFEAY